MKFSIRLLAGILLVLMTAACFSACGTPEITDEDPTETEPNTAAETDKAQEAETASAFDRLDGADYGTEFVVLTKSITGSNMWDPLDIVAEDQTGDLITDAIFERNGMVQEKLGIRIVQVDDNSYETHISAAVQGGSHEYDTVDVNLITTLGSLAVNGYLLDMKQFPVLDLSQSYWDPKVNGSIEILGRQYAAISEITYIDDYATWCLFFNKERATNVQIDPAELYGLAKDGNWTTERLYDYAELGVYDINGDGMDSRDYWGIYTQYEAVNPLLASTGLTAVVRGTDGSLINNLDNPSLLEALEELYGYMSDKTVQLYAENSGFSEIWNGVKEQFASGYGLFFIGPVGNIDLNYLRNMDQDYGVLPLPKLYEEGEYTTTVQYNNATAIGILTTTENPERTAHILEAMAAASSETLTPAFYEKVLLRKRVKDEESSEMLDLIFRNKAVDTALLYNWANVGGMFQRIMKAGSFTYASETAAIHDAFERAISETLSAFS